MNKIDIVSLMIKELDQYPSNQDKIKLYMDYHKSLCNDVLYTSPKYKDSAIILTNIFKTLMADLCKEITNYLNEEVEYKHE